MIGTLSRVIELYKENIAPFALQMMHKLVEVCLEQLRADTDDDEAALNAQVGAVGCFPSALTFALPALVTARSCSTLSRPSSTGILQARPSAWLFLTAVCLSPFSLGEVKDENLKNELLYRTEPILRVRASLL